MPSPHSEEFEPVAKGLYLEGLAVDYVRDVVWYSDVIAGGIHGIGTRGSVGSLNPERMWTGGVIMNEDGSVLSSGVGGIMWNHPDTGKSGWLISHIGGSAINGVNEMITDGTGGIYFGTIDLEKIIKGEPPRPAALYRLTVQGDAQLLADGLGLVNGITLSADRKRLYCNETFDATYVFDVAPDMSLSNRRLLLKKEDCDGMALDADGNLWITGFRSSELTRAGPDGSRRPPIATPAGAVTQIRFGGRDMRDYYITCVPADGGDGLAVGVRPTQERSVLYRGRSDVAGLPIAPARFKLR
ncbi:MAG TPA: SMP-30/gluconolactonase/LRE family protein [Steroidobacteraceae bacterium]|nr:SMP-30/gluconolactonase/LRE family protein [Steroidobacteraceae bacterium]